MITRGSPRTWETSMSVADSGLHQLRLHTARASEDSWRPEKMKKNWSKMLINGAPLQFTIFYWIILGTIIYPCSILFWTKPSAGYLRRRELRTGWICRETSNKKRYPNSTYADLGNMINSYQFIIFPNAIDSQSERIKTLSHCQVVHITITMDVDTFTLHSDGVF